MKNEKSYFCNCLFFSAGSFSRNMTKLAEEAFSATGLAPSHAFVLMTVNRYESGVSPSLIAKEMHLTPSTVTRLVDKLQQKQLVERKFSGKSVEIKRTRKSLEMQKSLETAWNGLYKKYTEVLGEAFSNELADQLYEASEKIK